MPLLLISLPCIAQPLPPAELAPTAQPQSGASAQPPSGASPQAQATPAESPAQTGAFAPPEKVSSRNIKAAEVLYRTGARAFEQRDYLAAEKDFAEALKLNPSAADALQGIVLARQGRVAELVHRAAAARQAGNAAGAQQILEQAQALDPDNRLVAEHMSGGGDPLSPVSDPLRFPAANLASTLAGAIQLKPQPGTHTFHERGDRRSVLRAVYQAFGLRVQFDPALEAGAPVRFDMENASFSDASAALHAMTHSFAVPLERTLALIANDTAQERARLVPQLEETIYLPGLTNEQMQELANVARNVFDVKTVSTSAASGTLLLRADEPTLKLLNAQYAEMLDSGSDVLLDVNLYEVDQSRTRNLGVTFPSQISAFPLATELRNILDQNSSLLSAAQSSGLLKLTGNKLQDQLTEIEFLFAGGYLTPAQQSEITGLLGTIGRYSGLPFLGVSIASGATLTAVLTSSDARLLDSVQLRVSHNALNASFRSGSRYPIVTSTYSSGLSNAASSALAGAGSTASSLLAQYGISGAGVTVPQVQYEDLGLTLKATPRVLRNREVNLALDLKVEALGAGSLNGIPVLNNRQFSSTLTVPAGQTALLVSEVNRSELTALQGFPGINELPGLGGTERNSQKESSELLITLTPHLVREGSFRVAGRRLASPHPAPAD